jgi:hypothetical protein
MPEALELDEQFKYQTHHYIPYHFPKSLIEVDDFLMQPNIPRRFLTLEQIY